MNEEYENGQYDNQDNKKPAITWRFVVGIIVGCITIMILKGIGGLINSCIDTYNELVSLEENVNQAQSEVENAMQRRAELISGLVETLKASDAHDKELYAEVSSASENLINVISKESPEMVSDADYELSLAINRLLIFVREYPDVVDKDKYSKFMTQLEGSVNRIFVSRSNYNEIVGIYNTNVRQYPGMIIAKLFGFDVAEYFKADDIAKSELNFVNFD